MANNNQNLPYTGKIFTVPVYILGIALFIFCAAVLFGKCGGSGAGKGLSSISDSTITTVKKDTTKAADGKTIIVSTTNTTTSKQKNDGDAAGGEGFVKRMDTLYKYFILVFGIFIVLLVIPRIKTFDISASGIKAEMYEMAKALNEVQGQAEQKTDGALAPVKAKLRGLEIETLTKNIQDSDPNAGQFGFDSERNGRRLKARIKKIDNGEWANITVWVESTDAKKPLTGVVYFHLHPTFVNPVRPIIVLDGKAEITLKAWGAFTIGAECDDKKTKLELNLANHEEAFSPFKDR